MYHTGQRTPTFSAANDTCVYISAPGLGYSPQCRMPVCDGRKHGKNGATNYERM